MSVTFDSVFKAHSIKHLPNNDQYRLSCVFPENHAKKGAGDGSKSLFLTPAINAYHCFSCGASGSLVSLLTVKMGVPLFDALDLVGTSHIESTFKEKEEAVTYQYDLIIDFEAPKQFTDRGFSPRFLRKMGVGVTDYKDSDGSIRRMAAIPWYDHSGNNIVGLKLRGNGRNFLNYPRKFEKSTYLYNYHNCTSYSSVYVVEGETDVWKTINNGTPNVCGTGGGGFSYDQSILLSTFTEINLAFDNDDAGYKNIEIAYLKLSPFTNNINVVLFKADDPGKCSMSEWKDAVCNRIPYAEYAMLMSLQHGDWYLPLQEKASLQHQKDIESKINFGI